MAVEFDIAAFRAAFPAFASEVLYPDATIQAAADQAACLLSSNGCGCETLQLQLMVAHLLTLGAREQAGSGATGPVVSATIDKVSVTLAAPPGKDPFTFWLYLTPYGSQLAAMLSRCAAGGLYIGGAPERAAFRSVGGLFPRGGRRW
jgi:hypothetical protein